MLQLDRKKKNDDRDFVEACQWLDFISQGGAAGLCVGARCVENARRML